jgi:hypothetical protein
VKELHGRILTMGKQSREEALPPRMGWGESRILFYVHYQDIQDLLGLGWSLKKVHKHLFEVGQQLSYGQLSYHQIKATKARQMQTPAVQQKPETILKDIPENLPKLKLPQRQGEGIRAFIKGPSNPDPKDVW